MMQTPKQQQQNGVCQTNPHDICQGVLNGSITSVVSDTAATSNAFLPSAPMLPTGTVLIAMFHLPNRATAATTIIHKLHHNLQEPACSVNILPSLVGNSLLSTVEMVKAGYMAIYDDKEVNFYLGWEIRLEFHEIPQLI
jgi:hypothetical protein